MLLLSKLSLQTHLFSRSIKIVLNDLWTPIVSIFRYSLGQKHAVFGLQDLITTKTLSHRRCTNQVHREPSSFPTVPGSPKPLRHREKSSLSKCIVLGKWGKFSTNVFLFHRISQWNKSCRRNCQVPLWISRLGWCPHLWQDLSFQVPSTVKFRIR